VDGADRVKITAYDPDASRRMTTGIATAQAGGDLGGAFPGPTVQGIGGYPIDLTGLANGDVLTWDSGTSTWVLAIPGGLSNPMTTKGDIIVADTGGTPLRLGASTSGYVLTTNGAGTLPSYQAPVAGGLTTVDQDISGDFTSSNDSSWHDITGLTGISLTAGTWIALVDLEIACGASYGAPVRVWDGTTTYAQAEAFYSSPVANLSTHWHLASKPFTLGGSATMAIGIYSDTVVVVKQYPTRGGLSTAVASHVTFMKVG
jgi:hypothetical protein